MKLFAPSLLVGAATVNAFSRLQQVLQAPEQASEALARPLHSLKDSLKSLTGDARALWDEVSMQFPEAMDKTSFFSPPKKHTRRPDSHWDNIIKGADVQSVWVENKNGQKERDVDGKLEAFNLRSKRIDPSELGVDPEVKQYSGYLDDNQNDKHLFYCSFAQNPSQMQLC